MKRDGKAQKARKKMEKKEKAKAEKKKGFNWDDDD